MLHPPSVPPRWWASVRRLLYIKRCALLAAAHVNSAIGIGWRAPAFAGHRWVAEQLRYQRSAGDEHQLAVIGQRQNIIAHSNHIAGAEAFLLPLDFSGGQLHALERAVAVFFEAEHAIEVAVLSTGAPVICHVLVSWNAPQLLGVPLSGLLATL